MVIDWFLSIFLDEKCSVCRQASQGKLVCEKCDRQIQKCRFTDPKCYWRGDFPLFVLGQYDGTLKRAIATMKYQDQPKLGAWLGEQLATVWQKSFVATPNIMVMPIPMHPEKLRQRGFNQAELVAQRFAELNKLRCDNVSLKRTKATKALFELNLAERQQEMKEAFAFDVKTFKRKSQQPVLLIDDIYTSGTTAREAKRVLQNNGVSVFGIAAIATPKSPTIPKPTQRK